MLRFPTLPLAGTAFALFSYSGAAFACDADTVKSKIADLHV